MKLNMLTNNPGAKKTGKRLGRGIGSGKGKTCGRGEKGQKARSGVSIRWFEGGQMPMKKRLPKRGFNCPSSTIYKVVGIAAIERLIDKKVLDASKTITKEDLVKVGLVKTSNFPVKLLSDAKKLTTKFTIQLDAYSKSAKEILEKVGGQTI